MQQQPYSPAISADIQPEPIEKIILRSMNEGVITIECNGNIASANPAALKLLGLNEGEILGRSHGQAFTRGEHNVEFTQVLGELIESRTTPFKELPYVRTDGQRIDLSVTTAFLDLPDCRPGMENAVIVFRDVTAFKELERVKKRAVNHLSHELETPLAIVAASVDKLMKPGISKETALRNYDRISRNLKRLHEIQFAVKQIVDPLPVNPRPLDPAKLAEQTVAAIRKEASNRDVALIPEVLPVGTIVIDPELLLFSMRALVKNAIENSPDLSQVRIALSLVTSGLQLTVEDRGVGIPVMDQEFIWEGLHHTQATDEYSSRKPFDFDAGGKGLELLRIKAWSEAGHVRIVFQSERCRYIPTSLDHCPGNIALCPHVTSVQGCRESGGSLFCLTFPIADR